MIYSVLPNLTDKQKQAFDLAVESGYYGYPKKVKLISLAKRVGISLSTFQFHLANAEAKLMPFFSKKL
jgi:predicted DNA binding protein